MKVAIDRNIISWGEDGFRGKSYIEIYNLIYTNRKAIFGNDIDLSLDTGEGEYIRMLASLLYNFANLSQEVYYSLDINNAKGELLDILLYQSGNMIRKGDTYSKLSGILSWSGPDIRYKLPSDNDSSESTILIQDKFNITWLVKPIVDVTDLDDIDSEGYITLSSSGTDAEIICTVYGDYLLDNDISELLIDGDFITNDDIKVNDRIIYARGSLTETDAEFRLRKQDSLIYNSTSLVDSVKIEIMKNVLSVKDVVIFNANKGDMTIPLLNRPDIVIPNHYIFVMVQPVIGTNLSNELVKQSIAKVIRDKITLGISTYQDDKGALSPNYIEQEYIYSVGSVNTSESIFYYIADSYNPKLKIELRIRGNTSSFENSKDVIKEKIIKAIEEYSKLYRIGQDIDVYAIGDVIRNTNADIQNPLYEVANISVTGSLEVKNGYWLFDRGVADENIVIEVAGVSI